MKEIDNFRVHVQRIGPIQHIIQVQPSGENYGLIVQVNHPGEINEENAYNYYKDKKNWKNWTIDI